ncbi:MAG: hypothetical protein WBB23_16365 [Desulforhopalus sp.]
MTLTVTTEGIVLMLLALLGLAIGIYLLVILKKANQFLTEVNKTLAGNQQKIENLLLNLEVLSGNAALLSEELKKQIESNKVIVSSIFQTGADSMLLLSDATSRIRTLVANFNQIISTVNRFIKKKK